MKKYIILLCFNICMAHDEPHGATSAPIVFRINENVKRRIEEEIHIQENNITKLILEKYSTYSYCGCAPFCLDNINDHFAEIIEGILDFLETDAKRVE